MTRPQSNSASSEAMYHRLNAYALTAAATGVASLALAPYASATIVYTPAQVNIVGPHAFYQLDLNHDGVTDFTLGNAITTNTDQFFWQLKLGVPAGNAAVGTFIYHGFINVRAMPAGSKIGPGANFYKSEALMASVYYGGGGLNLGGNWIDKSGRYLGLRFQINGETHYGWARINVQVNTTQLTVYSRITGYAYETTPNKPIAAGQTHDIALLTAPLSAPKAESQLAVRPDPSRLAHQGTQSCPPTLVALALGSNGIAIWRREESTQLAAPPITTAS
jgi:hypothetical protein